MSHGALAVLDAIEVAIILMMSLIVLMYVFIFVHVHVLCDQTESLIGCRVQVHLLHNQLELASKQVTASPAKPTVSAPPVERTALVDMLCLMYLAVGNSSKSVVK